MENQKQFEVGDKIEVIRLGNEFFNQQGTVIEVWGSDEIVVMCEFENKQKHVLFTDSIRKI